MHVWRNAPVQAVAVQCGGGQRMRMARRRQVRGQAAAVRVHLVFDSFSPLEVCVRALLPLLMWVLKYQRCSCRAL